ncbi:MAG: protein-L-isoaspartate(D-aspartate) O-methyltransferase [Candidatus Omnitrophota bacterium]|nr:protein-L-isoaspartate(D-aspartate) O-methyltransferase [Candidatus Omnitrophota bacterium]
MEFEILRNRMVDEQLIPRGINDNEVLNAFRNTPRHLFVPDEQKTSAYADFPLPIGNGQTISQPFIVALMTQSLNLKENDKVLEIGTGSGYQTAILAQLCEKVYSIERFDDLAEKAKKILQELDFSNITIKTGDGTLGWEEFSPFDAIIITAATPQVPQILLKQLKINGRMILPLGGVLSQMLTLIIKQKLGMETKDICPCVFVRLVGKYGWGNDGS